MPPPLRVLHLASFTGNVGDNANHAGFRPWFERMLNRPVLWQPLEIREFYWKERALDNDFVELANDFDLLVIGGGNYFELWVGDSGTGTSIDISLADFGKIKIPIFFNALGVDAGQGTTELTVTRFKAFLEVLLGSDQYLVTVRNDGATRTLAECISDDVADEIGLLPDGGFFAKFGERRQEYLDVTNGVIGINVACDMESIRFRKFADGDGYANFCQEMSKTIEIILGETSVNTVFFPHIYSDLRIITDILYQMPDKLRRSRIGVAPYCVGAAGAECIFGGYNLCDLIMGMRFHANVCPIGMSKPTIGLNSYPQIAFLYDELGYPDGCVDVSRPGFAGQLAQTASAAIQAPAELSGRIAAIRDKVYDQRSSFEPVLTDWLVRSGFKIG